MWIIDLCRDKARQHQNHARLLLNLLLKGGGDTGTTQKRG
jgi:hypothetical protein